MTLLGVPASAMPAGGGFSMGTSGSNPPTMGMSLDEMIASRRNKDRRVGGRKSGDNIMNDPNQVSNVDRSVATSRAKRNAKLQAHRGQSTTGPKASQMEIEREVQKQGQQTLLAKAKKAQSQKKQISKLDPAEKAEIRNERRKLARAAAKAKKEQLAASGGGGKNAPPAQNMAKVAETAPLGRPPSKKAVKAAVTAMEEKGFVIPQGYQMVISFAPTSSAITSDPSTGGGNQQKPAAKKGPPYNNKGGGNQGGGNNNNFQNNNNQGGNNNPNPYRGGGGGGNNNNNRRGRN